MQNRPKIPTASDAWHKLCVKNYYAGHPQKALSYYRKMIKYNIPVIANLLPELTRHIFVREALKKKKVWTLQEILRLAMSLMTPSPDPMTLNSVSVLSKDAMTGILKSWETLPHFMESAGALRMLQERLNGIPGEALKNLKGPIRQTLIPECCQQPVAFLCPECRGKVWEIGSQCYICSGCGRFMTP